MRELTQTVTATPENGFVGNCWQTCIACLLDLDPAVLPPQENYDKRVRLEDGSFKHAEGDNPSYWSALTPYLRDHHDLAYVELHLPDEAFPLLRVADPGYHLMTGRTVRSDSYGGMRHVVVGRYGQVAWDPHPSHAGLLEEIRWALLVPYPKYWRESDARPGAKPYSCVCPACSR